MSNGFYIASVQIQGFKSINLPIRLELSRGCLIGVVGANGSGKSNILDAICFAMSPSTNLRVKTFEDLKNTQNANKCMVSVGIASDAVESRHTELRVELNHEHHRVYYLDGRIKTGKFIKEFLRQKGLLLDDRLSIIQQSKITRLVDKNSQKAICDVIEMTSGLDQWKSETQTAKEVIDKSRQNISESSTTIKRLEIELKKTEQEFEESRVFEETKRNAIEKGSRFFDLSINTIHELENHISQLNDARSCLEIDLRNLDEEILEDQARQYVSEAGVSSDSNENTTTEYLEVMERLACLGEEITACEDELSDLNMNTSFGDTTKNAGDIELEIECLEVQINENEGRLVETRGHLINCKDDSSIDILMIDIKKLEEQKQDLMNSVKTKETMVDQLEQEITQLKQKLLGIDQQLNSERQDFSEVLRDLSCKIQELNFSRNEAEDHLEEFQRILQFSKGQIDAVLGKGLSAAPRLIDCFNFKVPGQDILHLLPALHCIAGTRLKVLVTEYMQNVPSLLREVNEKSKDRKASEVEIWPLDQLQIRDTTSQQQQLTKSFSPGDLVFPLMLFDSPEKYHKALMHCFGSSLIVKNEEIGDRVLELAPEFRCVTVDGIIREKGMMTGGWNPSTQNQTTLFTLKYKSDINKFKKLQTEHRIEEVIKELGKLEIEKLKILETVKCWENMKSRKQEIQQILHLKEEQIKEHSRHISDLNSIEETLKRKAKMLKTVNGGAKLQEILQREIQNVENQLKSDSNKLERLKRDVASISQNKAQEERRRIQKRSLMNKKQSLANQINSTNKKKTEIENKRQQQPLSELTTLQKDLKNRRELMKDKLLGTLSEQEDLQKTIKDVRKDLEIVQSMDSAFSELLQDRLHQGAHKSILQEDWKQELTELKSQIAQLKVELQSKTQNSRIQNSRMIGYCQKKDELKMIQENIHHLRSVLEGTEHTISSNENTQLLTNKQVFEKINVLFQEQCAKLLPQMRIQLKAEDEQDPSKGIQIKSGLQNIGAEQLSGGQRTLISIVLLVSAAKVGGYAQTLLMDEIDAFLDESNQEKIGILLKFLSDEGYQILAISHNTAFQKSCHEIIQVSMEKTGTTVDSKSARTIIKQ